MKNITTICCIALILTGATSCDNYLDIVPKGEIIPVKTHDYRLLLDQIANNGRSNGLVSSYSKDVCYGDDMKITLFSSSMYGAAYQNALMFAEHIYQDFESDPDWEALYNQIYVSNMVVLKVMDSKEGSDFEKKALLAEAYIHRAFAFFTLVNLYAKQYDPATAANDLGVPLRVSIDFEEDLSRASVKSVYDFILNGLKQAIELKCLPTAPRLNFNNRPTEAAAYILLARTHLFMNNIEEANLCAEEAIKRFGTLIDYNQLPPSPMFPGGLQFPILLQNAEAVLIKTVVDATSLFYASDELAATFDKENDLRLASHYFNDALMGMTDGYISGSWSGRTPAKGCSSAEAYLIRAECRARLNNVSGAISDLNHLRSYRYRQGSNYQLSAANAAEALALVKSERRRELAFQGYRFFDIKRYWAFDHERITVTHVLNGTTYTITAESPRAVLPIGRKYIDLNPEIIQNPR